MIFFKFFWIFNIQTKTRDHPVRAVVRRNWGMSWTFKNFIYLQQTWNQSPTWISSTGSKYLEFSYMVVQSLCILSSLVHNKHAKCSGKKKSFFFGHLNQFFATQGLISNTNCFKPTHTQPKLQAAKGISKQISINMGRSCFEGSKLKTKQNWI